jgi:ABC-type sugar transport system substrate-binding protein
MKRLLMMAAALASLAFATAPSPANAADIGLSIRIGDPYPHYRGGYVQYQSSPDVVLIPRTSVYYVRN